MARKGLYEEWLEQDKLTLIQAWARDGLTNEQIAHNIGIAPKTLYEWINKFSEISNALKKGKEVVDIEVENSLLKRALGYTYEETTRELSKETGQLVVTKVVTKQVVPDTTAMIYWLKNRKPDLWRDKPTQEKDVSSMIESMNTLTKAMLNNVAPNRKIEDFE